MTGDAEELVTVTVNRDTCIGAGQCEMLEEATFYVDDDTSIADVIGDGRLPQSRADQVIARCPASAISIISAVEGE